MLDVLLVDSFETPIVRPSLPAMQKKFYSGKKEAPYHQDAERDGKSGEVLAIETGHPGPKSDNALYQESVAVGQYPQAARRGDLGYLGVPEIILPHTRKRGKKGEQAKELTPEQKAGNPQCARSRVYVEYGVRRVKA